jgi:hypothetical protein
MQMEKAVKNFDRTYRGWQVGRKAAQEMSTSGKKRIIFSIIHSNNDADLVLG